MIKCIIFDLGDVLVHNNPRKACERISNHCPLNPDEVGWFAPEHVHKLMDTGKITKRDLYRQAVKNLGLKGISQKKFESIYADIFTNNKPVQSLALKLSKNYKLVLLSNTDPIHFEHIKNSFPILSAFSRHVVSYKVGFVKPSRQIYLAALKTSGCKASECVFVDDKMINVLGARKLGINAMRYKTPAKLKSDLKKLGVKV